MKRISLIFCFVFSLLSCEQEEKKTFDTFTVSGTIEGLNTSHMSTSYRDELGNRISDSIMVENNSFSYTAKITKPTHIIFWPNVESTIKRSGRGYYPAKSSQFAFIASPGDHIVFEGKITDFVNAYPSGSEANDDLALINKTVFPLLNKSVNTLLERGKLAETDSINIKILEDSIQALDDEVKRLKKAFITSNPDSKAAIWYLSDMMMRSQISDEDAINLFQNTNQALKENPYYQEVAARVKGIETTLTGRKVPDFISQNVLDETTFSFSSLEGKYVLIDFWGTWCMPCIAEMPALKEYQEKYKDQLAILGINSGDTKEKIIEFVTPKNYDWTQLISGEGDDNLVLKFNVSGFPTKFIIDPSGKILHRFVGGGEDSFTALDNILGE